MPHRIVLVWQVLGIPVAWISAVSAVLGVVTADGVATAITVIGLALVVTLGRLTPALLDFLVKVTPALADALRQVGYAVADVKGRIEGKIEENAAEIERLKVEAESAKAEARVAKALVAELQKDSDQRRERHEQLTDIVTGAVLEVRADSRDVKAALEDLTRRSNDPDKEPTR